MFTQDAHREWHESLPVGAILPRMHDVRTILNQRQAGAEFAGEVRFFEALHVPAAIANEPADEPLVLGRRKVNGMEEGRKPVFGIMASILLARHLKTTEDLHDSRPRPRTESLAGSEVQWTERIMRGIDGTFASSGDDRRWPRT